MCVLCWQAVLVWASQSEHYASPPPPYGVRRSKQCHGKNLHEMKRQTKWKRGRKRMQKRQNDLALHPMSWNILAVDYFSVCNWSQSLLLTLACDILHGWQVWPGTSPSNGLLNYACVWPAGGTLDPGQCQAFQGPKASGQWPVHHSLPWPAQHRWRRRETEWNRMSFIYCITTSNVWAYWFVLPK